MRLIPIRPKPESRCECCGAKLERARKTQDVIGHGFKPLCAECGTVQTWARPTPAPPPTARAW